MTLYPRAIVVASKDTPTGVSLGRRIVRHIRTRDHKAICISVSDLYRAVAGLAFRQTQELLLDNGVAEQSAYNQALQLAPRAVSPTYLLKLLSERPLRLVNGVVHLGDERVPREKLDDGRLISIMRTWSHPPSVRAAVEAVIEEQLATFDGWAVITHTGSNDRIRAKTRVTLLTEPPHQDVVVVNRPPEKTDRFVIADITDDDYMNLAADRICQDIPQLCGSKPQRRR
jgi:hypothetical protein